MFNLLTITAMGQAKGRFEVHDLGNFKLHVSMKQIYAACPGKPDWKIWAKFSIKKVRHIER